MALAEDSFTPHAHAISLQCALPCIAPVLLPRGAGRGADAGRARAQATYYGQQVDQDAAGTCSFGGNFANSMHLPWTNGVRHSVALNDNMFNDSLPCGTCIMYRGRGQGIGTTPVPTTNWTMAIVNNRRGAARACTAPMHVLYRPDACPLQLRSTKARLPKLSSRSASPLAIWKCAVAGSERAAAPRALPKVAHAAWPAAPHAAPARGRAPSAPRRCPECSFGDIDLNLAGDGRWKVEWHAVPCNVGDSKLKYSIVVSTYYWFSLVVSNTRCAAAYACVCVCVQCSAVQYSAVHCSTEQYSAACNAVACRVTARRS